MSDDDLRRVLASAVPARPGAADSLLRELGLEPVAWEATGVRVEELPSPPGHYRVRPQGRPARVVRKADLWAALAGLPR